MSLVIPVAAYRRNFRGNTGLGQDETEGSRRHLARFTALLNGLTRSVAGETHADIEKNLCASAEARRRKKSGAASAADDYAAAFLRLASSRASTSATWASIAGLLRPFCLAMSCTSLSARSILGAPFCNARAADAGRVNDCAAAAYFSNGTKSSGLAPSLTQRSNTKL